MCLLWSGKNIWTTSLSWYELSRRAPFTHIGPSTVPLLSSSCGPPLLLLAQASSTEDSTESINITKCKPAQAPIFQGATAAPTVCTCMYTCIIHGAQDNGFIAGLPCVVILSPGHRIRPTTPRRRVER